MKKKKKSVFIFKQPVQTSLNFLVGSIILGLTGFIIFCFGGSADQSLRAGRDFISGLLSGRRELHGLCSINNQSDSRYGYNYERLCLEF